MRLRPGGAVLLGAALAALSLAGIVRMWLAAPAAVPATTPPPAAVLDVNQASARELAGLPGLGPVLAQRIVSRRMVLGSFKRLKDLLDIPGIGPRKLARWQGCLELAVGNDPGATGERPGDGE
jgi:competence protein ComEA